MHCTQILYKNLRDRYCTRLKLLLPYIRTCRSLLSTFEIHNKKGYFDTSAAVIVCPLTRESRSFESCKLPTKTIGPEYSNAQVLPNSAGVHVRSNKDFKRSATLCTTKSRRVWIKKLLQLSTTRRASSVCTAYTGRKASVKKVSQLQRSGDTRVLVHSSTLDW